MEKEELSEDRLHADDGRLPISPLLPEDPTAIGPYRLLGRLGEGGMGIVYLGETPARHETPSHSEGAEAADQPARRVALKMIRPEVANDLSFTARFHTEVLNARKVASFCTAEVLHDGVFAGRPYMVTEYIPGVTLAEEIRVHGPLRAEALPAVALGIAVALAAIHDAGLVHRDLKPGNVILSQTGPRVIDFGIAKALDSAVRHTAAGQYPGTPGWWAPEQATSNEVTPAADIFTWGCLVGFAARGVHPFGRGNSVSLAARVLYADPELGDLPDPLDHLVPATLDRAPEKRPLAHELIDALSERQDPNDTLSKMWRPPRSARAVSERTRLRGTP